MIGRLHIKVLLVVGTGVVLSVAALAAHSLLSQRRTLAESAAATAGHVAEATLAGMARPMAAGDGAAVNEHLAALAKALPGGQIDLLDPQQKVVFSSDPQAIGGPLSNRGLEPEALDALRAAMDPGAREKPVRLAGLPPPVVRPVRNVESCHACHDPGRPVLGAVLVRQEGGEGHARLVATSWQTLAAGLVVALALIAATVALVSLLVLRPLTAMTRTAERMAAGDLTGVVGAERSRLAQQLDRLIGTDEIGQLAGVFEKMTGTLHGLLAELKESSAALDHEAGSARTEAGHQSSLATEQSAASGETTLVVRELARTSQQSSESAEAVVTVCDRSVAIASTGRQAVSQAVAGLDQLAAQVGSIAQSITELSELTRRIAEIVDSVEELAEESNLLALNAAIEAAQAGESGRGFSVVANEMRRLAGQSKGAAIQARGLLSKVVSGTRAAVVETEEGRRRAGQAAGLAHSAGETIESMESAIRETSEAIKRIAANARQQTAGVQQIVAAVAELSGAAADSLESAQRVEAVSAGLVEVSSRLTALAGRFKA